MREKPRAGQNPRIFGVGGAKSAWSVTALAAGAALLCHWVQGILVERLQIKRYGNDEELFPDLSTLPVFVAFASLCVSSFGILATSSHSKQGSKLRVFDFLVPAISQAAASPIGSAALSHVSYSTGVLFKASKSFPEMMGNYFFNARPLCLEDCTHVVTFAAGLALFLSPQHDASAAPRGHNVALGLALLSANWILTGITYGAEQRLKRRCGGPPLRQGLRLMHGMALVEVAAYVCLFDALRLVLPVVAGSPGPPPPSLAESVRFCVRNKDAGAEVALSSLLGALGQVGIFITIAAFDTHAGVQLTGVRKLFSILLSALFNGASLLPTQWFGVAVAFYAIAYSNVHASRRLGSYGTAMERSACREALETGRRRAVEKGADGVMGADGRDGRENEKRFGKTADGVMGADGRGGRGNDKRFGKTADGVMGADGRGGKRREGGSGIEIETRVERSVDGESEGRKRKDAIWKEIENGDTEMGVEEEESRSDCSMSAAWGSRDRTRRDATGLNGDVRRRRGRRWKSQTEVEAVSSSTG